MITEKKITCPVCCSLLEHDTLKSIAYPCRSEVSSIGIPKKILFCKNCGVGLADPMPSEEDLDKIYSRGEYWKALTPEIFSVRKYPLFYALALTRWQMIESFFLKEAKKKIISILDIGSGHGFLGIVAAKSKNMSIKEYTAVEKDKTFNESLKKTWQSHFNDKKLTIADSPDNARGPYDVVVFSHVLEHITDPRPLLKTVRERLTAGGVLFIDIPYCDYLFKENVFPHVLFFDRVSLKMLCEENGFKVHMIESYGQNRDRTPLRSHRKKDFMSLLERILYKIKTTVPENLLLPFFSRYYGISKKNPQGTWLRVLAHL